MCPYGVITNNCPFREIDNIDILYTSHNYVIWITFHKIDT